MYHCMPLNYHLHTEDTNGLTEPLPYMDLPLHYKQLHGTAMGSHISVIAEIVVVASIEVKRKDSVCCPL